MFGKKIIKGISLLLLLSLNIIAIYSSGDNPIKLNLEVGDYAVYLYRFYNLSDTVFSEPKWVYMLIEADMLTRFTENRTKYYVMENSKVYFKWVVKDILSNGYLMELTLDLINVVISAEHGQEALINKSFTKTVYVDYKGYVYHTNNQGWIEDWLFWIPGYELLNNTLKFYQPLPMIGGDYVIKDKVEDRKEDFMSLLEKLNNKSLELWDREIRYELREYKNIYINIGDAIISPITLYEPPNDIKLNVLGRVFTGERLIVGGRDSIYYVDIGEKEEVNTSVIHTFYRMHPNYFRLNLTTPENIFLGINGYIYVSIWGVSEPNLIIYDSVSGLLLYLKDEWGIGQALPPSTSFKDGLNGQIKSRWGLEMFLIDTSLELNRPIIGGYPQEDINEKEPGTDSQGTAGNGSDTTEKPTQEKPEYSKPREEDTPLTIGTEPSTIGNTLEYISLLVRDTIIILAVIFSAYFLHKYLSSRSTHK